MTNISLQRMSLYNIEWQALRVSLDFRTLESVKESCEKLDEYLAAPLSGYDTRSNRLYRVNNLLNATMMGLNGRQKRSRDTFTYLMLDEMKELVRECRMQYYTETSFSKDFKWDVVQEADVLAKASDKALAEVLDNLMTRVKFAKDTKKVDVSKTRPELLKYVGMLNTEIVHRDLRRGTFGVQ